MPLWEGECENVSVCVCVCFWVDFSVSCFCVSVHDMDDDESHRVCSPSASGKVQSGRRLSQEAGCLLERWVALAERQVILGVTDGPRICRWSSQSGRWSSSRTMACLAFRCADRLLGSLVW